MNFKTKTFAFVAGTAFALSSALGVAAQSSGDGGETSVNLNDVNPTGGCHAEFSADGEVDFGTYVWDGTDYVPTDGSGSDSLTATVTQDRNPDDIECDGDVSGTNLLHEERSPGDSIAALDVSVDVGEDLGGLRGNLESGVGISASIPRGDTGVSADINFALPEFLDASQQAGSYEGDLTVTVNYAP